MAEADNFEEDLFADLYDSNSAARLQLPGRPPFQSVVLTMGTQL
jgi:hypothetical protein